MRKTIKDNRKLYRDYAQKLIPGLSGGIIVIISTQLVSVLFSNADLELKSVNSLILIMVLFFFIVLSFVMYVKVEERYKDKHPPGR
jgi:UDP-N-acetylmuramyl pentapeptide phosphotransferase/UDP-N-acetylglucosamine-1-phosphate transferase